jgi:hypothetical protein
MTATVPTEQQMQEYYRLEEVVDRYTDSGDEEKQDEAFAALMEFAKENGIYDDPGSAEVETEQPSGEAKTVRKITAISPSGKVWELAIREEKE